jgi:hypothetical protein
LARSYFVASAVAVTFWPFAFQMAVDVLNRATGPAGSGTEGPSSYEMLTGEKPRVMNILPFVGRPNTCGSCGLPIFLRSRKTHLNSQEKRGERITQL